MQKINLNKLVLSAMFMAIGIILPFFTAQMKEIGNTLLPMHIPVMLCGLICGAKYGLAVGFVLPLLRGAVFGMPPLYPNAIWMAFELATYGFVIGFLYARPGKHGTGYLYACLLTAMVAGRISWGIVKTIILGLSGGLFTLQAFITGGLLDAIPGIIMQLILIPLIMGLVNHARKTT